jgi:hypothetical protein
VFKSTYPPVDAADIFAADDFVRQYANICTIDGLDQAITASLSNTAAVPNDFVVKLQALAARRIERDLGLVTALTLADLRDLGGAPGQRRGCRSCCPEAGR